MEPLEIIRQLKAKRDEFNALLAELEVWAQLKAQGLESAAVESLGWDTLLLTPAERRLYDLGAPSLQRWGAPAWVLQAFGGAAPEWWGDWLYNTGAPQWYNLARLKDGTTKPLTPFIRAAN